MTKREKADCLKIADHYGANGERNERIKDAMKIWVSGYESMNENEAINALAEEVADVELCLRYLSFMVGGDFKARVAEYRKAKIARQLRRMEAGE